MTTVRLGTDDAVELAATLQFLMDWLDLLAGHELRWLPLADRGYPIVDVRATLARSRDLLLSTEILP